ncbi:MAG: hypothetical protein Ct9H300mP27_06640 [Chloroflexota bacterium]|nr:MAG: hypothetical protein Ct9H300mP27_06640 [Chloroflexota bacterium]
MHSVGDISNFDSVSLGENARLAIQISAVLTESYLEMIEGNAVIWSLSKPPISR